MKKPAVIFSLFLCLVCPVFGMGGTAPDSQLSSQSAIGGVFLIDNFESGSLQVPRGWWTFDLSKAELIANAGLAQGAPEVAGQIGSYSLLLDGQANSWYAGGCGAYLAKENQNLAAYNKLQVDVFGNGAGTIKVELLDDDNNNWQVEQDAKKSYAPIYDDKFTYDIKVDWKGWQRVLIPLEDFVDDNAGVGDDIFNPEQANGSGGLLQIQLICLAAQEVGPVKFNLDNIALITK